MAKAPHRPVSEPAGSGALSRRHRTKNSRGLFCKPDDPDAVDPDAVFASPVSATPAADPPITEDSAPAEAPKRKTWAAPRKRKPAPSSTEKLVARLIRAIERELTQIEAILNSVRVSPARRSEAEKATRSLASLTRTLADMTKLNDAGKEARADHDDEALPRDLDDFRRTLERRLAQMADRGSSEADRGDEPGGDGMA